MQGCSSPRPDCSPQPTIKAFAAWGDSFDYQIAPGGSFEVGAEAWSLNRASLVAENEPWKVHGATDKRALKLPPAPPPRPRSCAWASTSRWSDLRANNTALLSTLTVEATIQTSIGLQATIPIGVVLPSGKWKPSAKYWMLVNLLPLLPGEKTPVKFTVRSVGLGTWFVDDFYLDPKCR